MLASLFSFHSLIALLTLTALEIVLGIDNLVFIAVLTGRMPKEQQKPARQMGLAAALLTRVALLCSISWLARLTTPLFTVPFIFMRGDGGGFVPWEVTGRALILFVGGLFLMYKATTEIYHKVELHDEDDEVSGKIGSFWMVIVNIALMDIIFSIDSVITAVGMVNDLPIMIAAIVVAIIIMIAFANPVSNFINDNASLKILALSFLLMIGTLLTAEALHFEIPKGFVYFAMFFSLVVDLVQMRYESNLRKRELTAVAEAELAAASGE